ncbi:hypothetical protein CO134_04075 [Candidatus Kuenenbacteria bacterium CG_4_9_14_3_um_filter_39_14]|uniref:Type II toxin-antitoxin system HicA family toxin n=6 Tax=Candidatus Kueneniibacteriota TaxID=1752740 RepID=A0A2M7IL85_9BACT|nr:type II toxin-antitoxin system HicA family toxin [Candidatus Kuenenbacteria bacterium]OIP55894.1 MAG: hypothetical protein AUK13_02035 [Candidatus Kuenenbacteria bacterium CG2_30_39_24]PIP75560.1 MAG: hypothetical protein COW86_03075 [Candidatus Kuenenbacteria bacterium CG22_combo_CG10-13_8_21_14_all_39_9]PIR80749.1 MAG: hypothetical protein COU24_02275 [Candidatus Kuenenbacteria bacterium CG10_big_fil_rev_8_21_14_0_10_39_14]PIW95563.1 MAG: hypothetical protein COZ84_02820 [Candidatus Kuenen
MSRLTPISSKKLQRILNDLGFELVRQKGSHAFYGHPDGRTTLIPLHSSEDISRGLLHKIVTEDIGIKIEEFNKLK